jgi:hypothetical protein
MGSAFRQPAQLTSHLGWQSTTSIIGNIILRCPFWPILPEVGFSTAMHLMREIEVPQTPTDAVFRTSRLYAVLFVLVCLTASVALVFLRWPHQRLAYCAAAAILVILLLFHRIIAARFHPSNWLVRLTDEGLYIHFRSYLNERLPSEDPTVVFI